MKGIASNVIAADAVPGAGRSGHPASRSEAEAAGFPRRLAEGMAFAARWTQYPSPRRHCFYAATR